MLIRRRRLERHLLRVSQKQDKGRGFNFLLSLCAILSESDAGNDGVERALGFVIKNRQISCSIRCLLYGT